MAQKLTYENKVALNINPTIPDINKCNATDMNEIKEVVNGNADILDTKTQIFQGNTPPENPEDGALWVDTNDEGVIVEVDQEVNSGSTNAVSNKAITNYVNSLNTYSTTETVIGTWVNEDGTKQPLYRKVVYLGNLPNASAKNVPHNISNLKLVTKYYGTYYAADYLSQAGLPYTVSNENQAYFSYQIAMDINQTNIILLTSVDRSAYKGQVTIEYTKTTDVPTSEEV